MQTGSTPISKPLGARGFWLLAGLHQGQGLAKGVARSLSWHNPQMRDGPWQESSHPARILVVAPSTHSSAMLCFTEHLLRTCRREGGVVSWWTGTLRHGAFGSRQSWVVEMPSDSDVSNASAGGTPSFLISLPALLEDVLGAEAAWPWSFWWEEPSWTSWSEKSSWSLSNFDLHQPSTGARPFRPVGVSGGRRKCVHSPVLSLPRHFRRQTRAKEKMRSRKEDMMHRGDARRRGKDGTKTKE